MWCSGVLLLRNSGPSLASPPRHTRTSSFNYHSNIQLQYSYQYSRTPGQGIIFLVERLGWTVVRLLQAEVGWSHDVSVVMTQAESCSHRPPVLSVHPAVNNEIPSPLEVEPDGHHLRSTDRAGNYGGDNERRMLVTLLQPGDLS